MPYQSFKKTTEESDRMTNATNQLKEMYWKDRDNFDLMLREFYFELIAGRLKLDDEFEDETKSNIMNGRSVRYWLLKLVDRYGIQEMFGIFNPIYKATGKAPTKEFFLEKLGCEDIIF